jgi:hypothetical protein
MAKIDRLDYLTNPVYMEIASRFLQVTPPILIGNHIAEMTEIGGTISEGITFEVRSNLKFGMEIASAKSDRFSNMKAFHWDDRKVWIYKLAALVTDGQGYREIGKPSLHIAIGTTTCNVHIDEFGFVGRGPNGEEYFTPDLFPHIVDELGYRAYVRPVMRKLLDGGLPRFLAEPAKKLVDQTYLVAPSSRNSYEWRFGPGIKLVSTKKVDLRFEFTCGNLSCSDNRAMFNFSLNLP